MGLYKHLAAAVAFSPRLRPVLAETAERATILASRVSLIHAGTHTDEKEAQLRDAMVAVGLAPETDIFWMEGNSPDQAILRAVQENEVDLLLAGALEKERPLRYYLGSVAHNLVREAPCSLLLLTEPSEQPVPTRRVVVVTDFSEHALIAVTKTIRWAEQAGVERVYIVRVISQFGAALVMSEGVRRDRAVAYENATRAQEESLLQDLVDAAGATTVPLETKVIEGHTGYAAAQFVRSQEADLLVMPSATYPGHFFERLFPSDMEWVLREIPCNLWVIRERLA